MSTATLAHDHPRVVRCSAGMTAAERKALWPNGVSAAQCGAMERNAGLGPYRAEPSIKPSVSAAPKKPVLDTGFNRAPGGAVIGGRAANVAPSVQSSPPVITSPTTGQKRSSPLEVAAAGFVEAFNRKFSQ